MAHGLLKGDAGGFNQMTKSKTAKKSTSARKTAKSARPVARKAASARPASRKRTLSAMIAKGVKSIAGKSARAAR